MQVTNGKPEAQRPTGNWPHYDAMASGLRNYWYPVAWSRSLKDRPRATRLLDQRIVLLRDGGRVYALHNQCPHRGVPLSTGRREFPGTWTCRYHGWTFDLESGVLRAALTDGPDSPICGKVSVQTYPAVDRLGLIWVYVGDEEPPPLETDVPEELFAPDRVLLGRFSLQQGNWRYACENAFDEGHFKYLHRYGAIHSLTWKIPAWSKIKVIEEEGGWLTRDVYDVGFGGEFPGLGYWPRQHFWNRRQARARISMRLPSIMRNEYVGTNILKFAWYVPVGAERYRYLQLYAIQAPTPVAKTWAHIYFWSYARWAELIQFNNQDSAIVAQLPETPPDRFYRPDASITAWRRFCEGARGLATTPPQLEDTGSAVPLEQRTR